MTLSSVWELLAKAETIAGLILFVGTLWGILKKNRSDMESRKSSPKHVESSPYPEKPREPILGSLENGTWVFIYGERKYDISKSNYIWGTGNGLSVMHSSHIKEEESINRGTPRVATISPRCEVYQTKDSKIFFMIRIGYFVGKYSKEEVREWLNAHGAPSEAYERAGIELRAA